jgi:hypothetical protein
MTIQEINKNLILNNKIKKTKKYRYKKKSSDIKQATKDAIDKKRSSTTKMKRKN